MAAPEFIRRLKSLNSHLIFEVSRADPTKYGIYRMQWVRDPLLGTEAGREQAVVHQTIDLETMLEIERQTVEK